MDAFQALVQKWSPRINLVSRGDLDHLRDRHIADSIQVADAGPRSVDHWVDLGSGGGFPGIVVSIMRPDVSRMTLVESDARKTAFLRTCVRDLELRDVSIVNKRIENLQPMVADVISARAVAHLTALLQLASPHLIPDGVALFPKGANWKDEIEAARRDWDFDFDAIPSTTSPTASILSVRNIRHAPK
ncbi:16S rRNA (guanine(527)-N(7))-methyltransferase RsmG [Jannaschia aquimarina]|uniref:16S rRNA (guanine(527)-N(7))-methyltransferase RsmG n=1 Tax=Jannaschia aquimarina TaxID=935700 RepID=UPI001FD4F57C|nr:16S rRNA (guanine(527)-N(7))-methyltransferase RsmG [Jannaschia aquimarina]